MLEKLANSANWTPRQTELFWGQWELLACIVVVILILLEAKDR